MVNVWLLATTLILSAQVASGADDARFEPYDCYRDLCVSRQQFCSDRERRCKYCLPGHCLNKNNTPKQCVPLCPGLLNPPTTTTTRPTTPRPTTAAAKPSPDRQNLASVGTNLSDKVPTAGVTSSQQGGLFISAGVLALFAIVMVALAALVTLAACNLYYVRRLSTAPDAASYRARRGLGIEEGQALLDLDWGDGKSGRRPNGRGSVSTVSSQPFKSTSPGSLQQRQKREVAVRTDILQPYTARPSSQLTSGPHEGANPASAAGHPQDNQQQHKAHDCRLLTTHGQSWSDLTAPTGFSGHPGAGQFTSAWARHGQENPFCDTEQTCPKSV